MVNNAISQSAQPIISYNYGAGLSDRVRKIFRLTIIYGVGFATVITAAVMLFAPQVMGIWLAVPTAEAITFITVIILYNRQ